MMTGFRATRPNPTQLLKLSQTTDDRPAAVLASSTSLFYFYRETLDRCASLSNRQPMLDLCAVFRKWLRVYSDDVLRSSLKPLPGASGAERRSFEGTGARRSFESANRIAAAAAGDVLCACAVLNTADYCADTAEQLQGRLKEKIRRELGSKVSLEAEQDLFRGCVQLLAICRGCQLSRPSQ